MDANILVNMFARCVASSFFIVELKHQQQELALLLNKNYYVVGLCTFISLFCSPYRHFCQERY